MAASVIATEKLSVDQLFDIINFDPDSADPVDVKWVPMKNAINFMAILVRTVGVGNIDLFQLIGNTEEDGSGTDVVLKVKTITDQPDAIDDRLVLEITQAEIADVGANESPAVKLKGISAQIELAVDTDELEVVYQRAPLKFAAQGDVSDIIA